MRDPYPQHGKRWTLWHPFSWTCRCGLDAWPCPVKRMLDRAELGDGEQLYAAGRVYADEHQAAERRRRRGAR